MEHERGLGRRRRRQEIGVFPANDELLDAVVADADADDFLPLDLLRVGDWVVDDEDLSVVVVVDAVVVAVAAAELVCGVGNPRAVIDVCDAKNVKLLLFLFLKNFDLSATQSIYLNQPTCIHYIHLSSSFRAVFSDTRIIWRRMHCRNLRPHCTFLSRATCCACLSPLLRQVTRLRAFYCKAFSELADIGQNENDKLSSTATIEPLGLSVMRLGGHC